RVRVEMKDAEIRMSLRARLDGAEGRGMIAADEADDLAAIEPRANGLVDEPVHLFAERVDARGVSLQLVVVTDAACRDDRLGERARLFVHLRETSVLGEHRDA